MSVPGYLAEELELRPQFDKVRATIEEKLGADVVAERLNECIKQQIPLGDHMELYAAFSELLAKNDAKVVEMRKPTAPKTGAPKPTTRRVTGQQQRQQLDCVVAQVG